MKKIIIFIWKHKIISFIILVIVFFGSHLGIQKMNSQEKNVNYATTIIKKGMLISSISGTGQVATSDQVELKSKVSGDIAIIKVTAGQIVEQGDLIAQIDANEAIREINEAKDSLENAKLDLEELLAPVDDLTLIQAENALADANDSLTKLKTTHTNNYQETIETKEKAGDNLEKAYEDAYNDIANAFLDLPNIMTGIYTVLFSYDISDAEIGLNQNTNNSTLLNTIADYDYRDDFEKYLDSAEYNYEVAKENYNENFDDYRDTTRYSEKNVIEELLEQTLQTTKKIADTIKSEVNMLDKWVEYRTDRGFKIYSDIESYQSNLKSYTGDTNSHLSSFLSAQTSIDDYKKSILSAERNLEEMEQNNPLELAAAERSVVEKKQKLIDLEEGATELEIKSKELAVQQKENSLTDAQQNYNDYFIRAPFNGTIAELNSVKGDNISSGTTIATLISDQKIAEVTLNEIDVAQVKVGQKATLTFDAISELSITGDVVEIDTLGTVSSGIVSYDVKINFDAQDERIKSGMSVSADIIVESKTDVLLAPINAVKTMGARSYVEVLVAGQAQKKIISTGSSNDTMVEVVDGLEEGVEIITQTTNSAQTQSSGKNGRPAMGGMMMIR